MKTLIACFVVVLLFCGEAVAQCPGGVCARPVKAAAKTVTAVTTKTVSTVRKVQPVRRVVRLLRVCR